MTLNSVEPLFCTICTYLRCSALKSLSSNKPVMPMMAFMGVRISWLMFARNSLFARVAASARVLASVCSVMSRYVPIARVGTPRASRAATLSDRSIHK